MEKCSYIVLKTFVFSFYSCQIQLEISLFLNLEESNTNLLFYNTYILSKVNRNISDYYHINCQLYDSWLLQIFKVCDWIMRLYN